MIVGVCGYGYTGSGAVLDLLKEYSECNVFDDFEFSIAYIPDGLKDLEYHLMIQPNRFMSSDIAVSRFIKYIEGRTRGKNNDLQQGTNGTFKKFSIDYINSIVQMSWRGYWNYDFFVGGFLKRNIGFRFFQNRVLRPIERITKKKHCFIPHRNMYFSVAPDDFYRITKEYINNVIKNVVGYDANKSVNVLNQPFPANCPEKCFCFFDNPKAIIVNRDPRDLFLFCKNVVMSNAAWIPTDKVEDFVVFYRKMREIVGEKKNTMFIDFEDLIYDYDNTVKKIEEFLCICDHTSPQSQFRPAVSVNNTQLFTRTTEYLAEIKYIENELECYLYDFSRFKYPSFNGEAVDI